MSVAEGTRGSLVSVERVGAHSALKLRMAQRVARLPRRFPVDHGIELRRVTYWTELSGQPQLATGLLGVPRRHRADVTLPWALEGHAASHSTYLAYIAHSYSRVYDQPLESLLTDDAAGLVRELFDGLHTADEIVSRLPPVPMPMFRETWVQGFRSGQASWFLDALRENEAVKWAPRAPLRLYYGASDVDVHPDDAVLGAQKLREHGGNVEVVAVGDFDHASVVFHAVPMVQEWFAQVADG